MFPAPARPARIVSTLSLLFIVLLAFPAFGANWLVTSTADSGPGSLREAIASAANNDTITFSLSYPATITLASSLTLGPSVSILGPGTAANGAYNLAISGNNSVGDFIVNAGATVSISGMAIVNGISVTGGGVFNAGTLTISNCLVGFNQVGTQLGGGIFNSGTLTLVSTLVEDNLVDPSGELGLGGGIYNYMGTVSLSDSDVRVNLAGLEYGGGGPVKSNGGYGGGIYNDNGTVTLTNSTVNLNAAATAGGGIYNNVPEIIFIQSAGASASAASAASSSPIGGTVTLSGSSILENSCTYYYGSQAPGDCVGGGGIYNQFGTVTATNSTFNINSTNSLGSSLGGGAIFNEAGTVDLSFVTLANDSADWGLPPGLGARGPNPATGEIVDSTGMLTMKNSIVANPTGYYNDTASFSSGNCLVTAAGLANSGGHNLSDDGSCVSFLNQTGDLNSTKSGLVTANGGLANNGGPTLTIALQPTSVAINAIPLSSCTDVAGNPVTTDQRGVRRPQPAGGKCDIGAYEIFQSPYQITSVTTYDLIDSVQALAVPAGVKIVLAAPLEAAVDLINQGVTVPAIYLTEGFIDLVKVSQATSVLTAAQASPLIGSAQRIIQDLTSNPVP